MSAWPDGSRLLLCGGGAIRPVPFPLLLMTTVFYFLFLPLLIVGAFVWWFFEPASERVVRMKRSGMTQRMIAERNGITVYKVRRILATA